MIELYGVGGTKEEPTDDMKSAGFPRDLVEAKYVQGLLNNHKENIEELQAKIATFDSSVKQGIYDINRKNSSFDVYVRGDTGNYTDTTLNVEVEYSRYEIDATTAIVNVKIPGFMVSMPSTTSTSRALLRTGTPNSNDLATWLGDSEESSEITVCNPLETTNMAYGEMISYSAFSYNGGSDIGRCFLMRDYGAVGAKNVIFPTVNFFRIEG